MSGMMIRRVCFLRFFAVCPLSAVVCIAPFAGTESVGKNACGLRKV